MNRRKRVSSRKLACEWSISRTRVQRTLKDNLKLHAYKDEHEEKRIRFSNWIRTNFRKEDTMKILFSDEKMFDIDGVYNSQNDRIWAMNPSEANTKGDIRQKRKFPQKVMVWLGVYSKGASPFVIFENGTLDYSRHIEKVLLVALKYDNNTFGNQ